MRYKTVTCCCAHDGRNERQPNSPFGGHIMNPIRIAKNWLSYRRTMQELANLPAHTLNDIGLTRYDIRSVASRSFR